MKLFCLFFCLFFSSQSLAFTLSFEKVSFSNYKLLEKGGGILQFKLKAKKVMTKNHFQSAELTFPRMELPFSPSNHWFLSAQEGFFQPSKFVLKGAVIFWNLRKPYEQYGAKQFRFNFKTKQLVAEDAWFLGTFSSAKTDQLQGNLNETKLLWTRPHFHFAH